MIQMLKGYEKNQMKMFLSYREERFTICILVVIPEVEQMSALGYPERRQKNSAIGYARIVKKVILHGIKEIQA
jgi:hypothetical protein